MPLFRQTYLKGKGVPSTLTWSLSNGSKDISSFLSSAQSGGSEPAFSGLAILVNEKGVMEFFAFSIDDRIVIVDANNNENEALESFLVGGSTRLVGFGITRIAMHIKQSLKCNVRAYDLPPAGNISPGCAVKKLLDSSADSFGIDKLWTIQEEDRTRKLESLCARAWISLRLASHGKWAKLIELNKAAETTTLSSLVFKRVFSMLKELDLMDNAEPRITQNDFDRIQNAKDGNVIIHNDRYKTRVRKSKTTRIVFVDEHGVAHHGKAKGTNGKRTLVNQTKSKKSANIKQVRVEGREEPTHSEQARNKFLLQLLQGVSTLSSSLYPFIGYLWFPGQTALKLRRIKNARIRDGRNNRPLNQSQANVVEAIINPHRRIVITHGPPGTGKTTTIVVAMREVYATQGSVWVVAQSNVGVKDIAESLSKHSVPFKLLVSEEFYYEWHEHIYTEVGEHLIRMSELRSKPREVEAQFHGTRIILCTVSMISNPTLESIGLFHLIPLRMLVVDEASQIAILDYMHIFGRFKALRKVCFFGDPKQLPPYGRDSAPTLQSIFDLPHFKTSSYFLDTQYRMPIELGKFISRNVYQSKLNSEHDIDGWNCVKFVDVWNSTEERVGKSWKNVREVRTVVHLVRNYFRHKEYCIITPYDAQRHAMQDALKRENLPWENVFNVDSFQGNEAEYVLVSVVRTTGPGFLKSLNRVNVMLTRCKAGMVIVSKREFTRYESVRKTLLGKLAHTGKGKLGGQVLGANGSMLHRRKQCYLEDLRPVCSAATVVAKQCCTTKQ